MDYTTVTVRDARARLSELLNQVANEGKIFSISRWGVDRRALLVPSDVYEALRRQATTNEALINELDTTLQTILSLVERVTETAQVQSTEVASLRDLAERMVEQAREADPTLARSARQEIARVAGRAENQSRTIRDIAEDIRAHVRALQRRLKHQD